MLGHDSLKIRVIHVTGEEVFVLLHSVDEESFEGLIEDEAEVLNRIGEGCLTKLLVGDGFLANLVEEKLIGGREVRSEALVDKFDETGKFDRRALACTRAYGGRAFYLAAFARLQLDRTLTDFLEPVEFEGDFIVEVVFRSNRSRRELRCRAVDGAFRPRPCSFWRLSAPW